MSIASSALCGRPYERTDASTTLALFAALLLGYSNIPLPPLTDFRTRESGTKERLLYIKIFLSNYVYLHVTR